MGTACGSHGGRKPQQGWVASIGNEATHPILRHD